MASLSQLVDPEVLANPYPLYHQLRAEDPVQWDPVLHAFVVTGYADALTVFHRCSAERTPTPEQLVARGLPELAPFGELMVLQMLFKDAPAHTRLRGLASAAFTPSKVERLRAHIQSIVDGLLGPIWKTGRIEVIADLANPLPATVTAEMLGVPTSDRDQLKAWSADFAEILGNFQHNPGRATRLLGSLREMTRYFRAKIRDSRDVASEGLVHAFSTAEVEGDRLSEDEVVANSILTMVGGQETTTNLIGNGLLTLLRNPGELQRLRADLSLIPSAVEEILRYESPVQHTARVAPEDIDLGGKRIRKRQAIMAVMGAANRDPERFPDPDHFDITRRDNRHLAFGWASHFCFGATLARLEGHIALETILRTTATLHLDPGSVVWRENLGFRGLESLHLSFTARDAPSPPTYADCERPAACKQLS